MHLHRIRARWQWLLDNLDTPLAEAEARFAEFGISAGELTNTATDPVLFHRLQDYSVRTSWKTELRARLIKIFDGDVFRPVREKIDAAFGDMPEDVRDRVLFANAAELYEVEAPDRPWHGGVA